MPSAITPESVLDLAAETALGRNHVLRVKGNAFAAEHICDGDYLVVSTRPAEDGDLIVARLNDRARVGRLVRHPDGSTTLHSRELLVPPVTVHEVQGVVLAIVRNFRRDA